MFVSRKVLFGSLAADALGKSHVITQTEHCFDLKNRELLAMFQSVSDPTSVDDWLAQYAERGQTFANWKQHYHVPVEQRSIAIMPIGDMAAADGPNMEMFVKYLRIFFTGVDVILLPGALVEDRGTSGFVASWDELNVAVRSRAQSHKYTKHKYVGTHRQFRIGDFAPLAEYALKHTRGKRIYCVIGVSMLDLHMDTTDEFCMGAATMGGQRVGVFSFARYHPQFSDRSLQPEHALFNAREGDGVSAEEMTRMLTLRCVKTATHELLHLFGVDHCIYARCLMNGTGHLKEDFSAPQHLCLICLHKLAYVLSVNLPVDSRAKRVIDIVKRYNDLADWFEHMHSLTDARWCRRMSMIVQTTVASDSQISRKRSTPDDDDDNGDERTKRARRRRAHK